MGIIDICVTDLVDVGVARYEKLQQVNKKYEYGVVLVGEKEIHVKVKKLRGGNRWIHKYLEPDIKKMKEEKLFLGELHCDSFKSDTVRFPKTLLRSAAFSLTRYAFVALFFMVCRLMYIQNMNIHISIYVLIVTILLLTMQMMIKRF